eukprot:scaffold37425_cov36-Phaeocystis_antarctica.AAC.1
MDRSRRGGDSCTSGTLLRRWGRRPRHRLLPQAVFDADRLRCYRQQARRTAAAAAKAMFATRTAPVAIVGSVASGLA